MVQSSIPGVWRFDSYLAILVLTSAWTLLYFLLVTIFPNKSIEWNNRLLALTHGASMTVMGLQHCLGPEGALSATVSQGNTVAQNATLCISVAFFLFDLAWCLVYQGGHFIILAHHSCSISAVGWQLLTNRCGAQTCCALGLMEVSNPFLQSRWFIRNEGYGDTLLFDIVEMIFIFVFTIARVIIGPVIVYKNLTSKHTNKLLKVNTLLLLAISAGFTINIYRYLVRKYTHQPASLEGGAKISA